MNFINDEINQFKDNSNTPGEYDASQKVSIDLEGIKEEEVLDITKRSKKSSDCWQHMTRKKVGDQNRIDIWKACNNYCCK